MPTVLRVGGFAFSFYADDHAPPHVHVDYGGATVIVNLEPVRARKNLGMKTADLLAAVRLVEEHRETLLWSWAQFDQTRRG
jgi:hypothetical protein